MPASLSQDIDGLESAWRKYLSLDPGTREGLEVLTSLVFVFLAALYAFVFLGDIIDFSKYQFLNYARYPIVIVFIPILARVFIFAQDKLAHGENKYSNYFRSFYPSAYLKNRLHISKGEADVIWFTIYNRWKNPSHEFNKLWLVTHKRSYSCRFIFYLQRWLLFGSVAMGSTVAAQIVYRLLEKRGIFDELVWIKIAIALATGGLSFWIKISNKIGEQPTGCWSKWKEISEMHHVFLERRLVGPAGGDMGKAEQIAASL